MILKKLGCINKKQWGFTLIELIVALAITGAITGGIATSIFQTLNYSARDNMRMVAVKQVENAIHYINRDVQVAQIIEPADDADGFPLVLTWVEWDVDNTQHVVTYSIVGNELKRNHVIDGVPGNELIMAQHIDTGSDDTYCDFDEALWMFTFRITVTVSGYPEDISEMREVRITPRTS